MKSSNGLPMEVQQREEIAQCQRVQWKLILGSRSHVYVSHASGRRLFGALQ